MMVGFLAKPAYLGLSSRLSMSVRIYLELLLDYLALFF
jgi:hypothetical protein